MGRAVLSSRVVGDVGDLVDGAGRLDAGLAGAIFPVFAGVYEDRGDAGAERFADVGFDVVAYHGVRARVRADGGEDLVEEALGGLADDVCVAAGGVLDRGDGRADVEQSPSARFQWRFFCSAISSAPSIAWRTAWLSTSYPNADPRSLTITASARSVVSSSSAKSLDLLVHDRGDAVVAALAAVPHGERRGGDQLAVIDSEPEAGELAERSIA